jgi:ATP-dependent exoDNAse (exonuclease V) beta subunit
MNIKNPVNHKLIEASAGSGKTYQLVRRYLTLLVIGVEAEKVVALTFTKKAAGQFYESIVGKLVELIEIPELWKNYFEASVLVQLEVKPDFEGILKRFLLASMGGKLGTLDSWMNEVIMRYSVELGLPIHVQVMEEDKMRLKLREFTEKLMNTFSDEMGKDQRLLPVFIELVANLHGEEAHKNIESAFYKMLVDELGVWMDTPVAEVWGAREQVRPRYAVQPWCGVEVFEEKFKMWMECGEPDGLSEKVEKAQQEWNESGDLSYWMDLLGYVPDGDLQKWDGVVKIKKRCKLEGKRREGFEALLIEVAWMIWNKKMAETENAQQLIAFLAIFYEREVLSKGWLTFRDLLRMMNGMARKGWMDDEAIHFWYRMDGRFDHWLLDEFQDTSRGQWLALEPLLSEVLVSDQGDRSFFAVGDRKQSIYQWRGADGQLFDELTKEYGVEGGLSLEGLYVSYRSAQVLLDGVNLVFQEESLKRCYEKLGVRWQVFKFQNHVSAKVSFNGGVRLWKYQAAESRDQEMSPQTEEVLRILQREDPLEKGMSCAILTFKNKEAQELAEVIRRELGMPVVCESKVLPLIDNELSTVVMSMLYQAEHPGDQLSLLHLRMSCLTSCYADDAGVIEENEKVRSQIIELGFSGWLEEVFQKPEWGERLREPFFVERVEMLRALAIEFDMNGDRSIDAFWERMSQFSIEGGRLEGSIQVMTVHKAKGLEFDMVILPFLHTKTGIGTSFPASFMQKRDAQDQVIWNVKSFRKELTHWIIPLKQYRQEMLDQAVYEDLCVLYVAMTRAKQWLYLLVPDLDDKKTKSQSYRYSDMVIQALAGKMELRQEKEMKWEELGDWAR